jgi:hypothetical protein
MLWTTLGEHCVSHAAPISWYPHISPKLFFLKERPSPACSDWVRPFPWAGGVFCSVNASGFLASLFQNKKIKK